jgi:hypothetical protein
MTSDEKPLVILTDLRAVSREAKKKFVALRRKKLRGKKNLGRYNFFGFFLLGIF